MGARIQEGAQGRRGLFATREDLVDGPEGGGDEKGEQPQLGEECWDPGDVGEEKQGWLPEPTGWWF